MQVHVRLLAFALVGAGLVSAQSFSLSSSCSSALKGLLTSPDAACLNPSSLLNFAIGSQSIPNTISTWLNGICTTGSCSNDTLAAVVSNITTGCAPDLSSAGISTQEITSIVQQIYPTVRKVACLKDDATSQFCVTETLTNVETAVGQLNLSSLNFLNIMDDVRALLTLNLPSLACTSCTKEAFTIALGDFPDIVGAIKPEVQGLCGASFIDGNLPDGITQTDTSGLFSVSQIGSTSNAILSYGFSGLSSSLLVLAASLTVLI